MLNTGHYVTRSPLSGEDKSHLLKDQWPNDLHYENAAKQTKRDPFLRFNACVVAMNIHFKKAEIQSKDGYYNSGHINYSLLG